ncbi:MAG TPA: ClpXP protease specificity-enhancing factor [Novimethylophilus sp.]|jgi:stringent starvation protein B|uniref:ClpXP protease specificity-enhancing factor n=1 Tax=Novimethylophilus sp. TaxID=2137426 RepID=UPI002F3E653C
MEPTSTKPYMIRALYEWCVDNGLTPHLMVAVDANTRVPMGYVKDGEIVLNINYSATKGLQLENESISFSARFNGVSSNVHVPMAAVRGIFARENGQGLFFEAEPQTVSSAGVEVADTSHPDENTPPPPPKGRPSLKVVK